MLLLAKVFIYLSAIFLSSIRLKKVDSRAACRYGIVPACVWRLTRSALRIFLPLVMEHLTVLANHAREDLGDSASNMTGKNCHQPGHVEE